MVCLSPIHGNPLPASLAVLSPWIDWDIEPAGGEAAYVSGAGLCLGEFAVGKMRRFGLERGVAA